MKGSFSLIIILCLTAGTRAGSMAFQPRLEAPTMQSLRSNTTVLNKRWIAWQPGGMGQKLWPNKKLTYAWADWDAWMAGPFIDWMTAMNLWTAAGLGEEFKWEQVMAEKCMEMRSECLMVHLNTKGRYSCTTGIFPLHPPDFVGPEMHIDPNPPHVPDKSESLAVLIAHEMGHAWGLMHEHQNPAYWSKMYNSESAHDGSVFSKDNFLCKNAGDWPAARDRAIAAGDDPEDLCLKFRVALKHSFSMANWLPLTNSWVSDNMNNMQKTPADVNWNSIMLYSTYQTGVSIILDHNQNVIPPREAVSTGDVEAIKALYGGAFDPVTVPLLNQPGNPSNSAFQLITCS